MNYKCQCCGKELNEPSDSEIDFHNRQMCKWNIHNLNVK